MFVFFNSGIKSDKLESSENSSFSIANYSGQLAYLNSKKLNPKAIILLIDQTDLGDIIGAKGRIFKTKTGELSINVTEYIVLSKSLRPLPEKYHGLSDIEIKYRQRYLDLMISEDSRKVFKDRINIVSKIRKFFEEEAYLEVETPMMHPIAGGAAAKPFVTHHNTLDMDLYLRIAPELYLKRLIIGGFEKVFEINRSFRNEGLSTKHNPEFTMMEWYEAYASMQDQMDLTKDIILSAAAAAGCDSKIEWGDTNINLSNFKQATLSELVIEHNKDISRKDLNNKKKLEKFLKNKKIKIEKSWGIGRMIVEVFEETG